MAQETRVAPIEFNNAPAQILLSMAEQRQQDALKQQQMEFEKLKYLRSAQEDEMKRRYDNAQTFNTVLQNQDWAKETRDMFMADLLNNFSNAKDVDSFDFRTKLGKQLGMMSQYNNIIKTVYAKADDFVKSMPDAGKQGFSADVFKNRYLKSALMNPDGTKKNLEQLQKEYTDDLAGKVYEANKHDLYDVSTAYSTIEGIINNAGTNTESASTKSRSGKVGSGSSFTIKYRPLFETYDKKTGEVKLRQDQFGYIDDKVYERLTSIPSVDAMATRKAKEFIDNYNNSTKEEKLALLGSGAMKANSSFVDLDGDNLPDALTMSDLNLVKKGFLTDQVRRNMLKYRDADKSTIITNNNYAGLSGPESEKSYDNLVSIVRSGENPFTSNVVDNVERNALQSIADESFEKSRKYKRPNSVKDLSVTLDAGYVVISNKVTGESVTVSKDNYNQRVYKGKKIDWKQ